MQIGWRCNKGLLPDRNPFAIIAVAVWHTIFSLTVGSQFSNHELSSLFCVSSGSPEALVTSKRGNAEGADVRSDH